MWLKEALENKKFDIRLQDKHLGEKKIKQEDLDKFISGLEDDTSNMTTTGSETSESAPQNPQS